MDEVRPVAVEALAEEDEFREPYSASDDSSELEDEVVPEDDEEDDELEDEVVPEDDEEDDDTPSDSDGAEE